MQSLEVNQRFLFGLKVVSTSVAAALSASWLRRMPNPTYCTSQDNPQKQDVWNFISNEFFYLECEVEVTWWVLISRGPLANNTEETCRLLSIIILDAIGNFGNGSDSQLIGRIENVGYCTWGSHPDLFSLDLVSLILRLSSPKFACR